METLNKGIIKVKFLHWKAGSVLVYTDHNVSYVTFLVSSYHMRGQAMSEWWCVH